MTRFPTVAEFHEDFWSASERARNIFSCLHPVDDWKGPINVWVDQGLVPAAIDAIVHFTATEPRITEVRGEQVRLQADGYRAGPAGP